MEAHSSFDAATIDVGLRNMVDISHAMRPVSLVDLVGQAVGILQKALIDQLLGSKTPILLSKSQAFQVREELKLVHFPSVLDVGNPTGVTVFFDDQGNYAKTVHVLLSRVAPNGARLQIWDNDVSVFDEATDNVSEVPVATQRAATARGFSWSNFNDCLSQQGIASWVGYMAAGACAAICAGTLGTGCIPCIGAVAGFGGGVIGTCAVNAFE
jgi:hypothetical protein